MSVENLFGVRTRDVLDVPLAGAEHSPWIASRAALSAAMVQAEAVLLAWGSEPTGPARAHHRAQASWLMDEIRTHQLRAWTVGGRPRHPSRWQRYTSRSYPDLDFRSALNLSLEKV